jgi:hypothetical protein
MGCYVLELNNDRHFQNFPSPTQITNFISVCQCWWQGTTYISKHFHAVLSDDPSKLCNKGRRSLFTADQAGQSAVGLGTEPCLGVIPAGTTGLSSSSFFWDVCFYFYYYFYRRLNYVSWCSGCLSAQPGWTGLCIYILQRQGGPVNTPRHRVPILVASYDTHGLRWDYSYSPATTRERLVIYQGENWPAICTWRLKFRTYIISLQNCAGSRQQSY